jgi:hypothetical protein
LFTDYLILYLNIISFSWQYLNCTVPMRLLFSTLSFHTTVSFYIDVFEVSCLQFLHTEMLYAFLTDSVRFACLLNSIFNLITLL